MKKSKELLKDWVPPAILRFLKTAFLKNEGIYFEGPFLSWEAALEESQGYASESILQKVLDATLKVKKGEAVFERDSVLFKDIIYSWPVTAGLMWAAARSQGRLSVLDYGGSLGTSYWQNRKFLEGLPSVRWSVVEQRHFVEAGRKYVQAGSLGFYHDIEECVRAEDPNVVLMSGVLQYLYQPYLLLEQVLELDAENVIIDLTMVTDSEEESLYLQHVPKSIYDATYPVRILSEKKMKKVFLSRGYSLVAEFQSLNFPALSRLSAQFKGFYLRKVS